MWRKSLKRIESMAGPVKEWLADDTGVTAIEYALLGMLVAIGALAGITALGGGVSGMWTYIAAEVGKVF